MRVRFLSPAPSKENSNTSRSLLPITIGYGSLLADDLRDIANLAAMDVKLEHDPIRKFGYHQGHNTSWQAQDVPAKYIKLSSARSP